MALLVLRFIKGDVMTKLIWSPISIRNMSPMTTAKEGNPFLGPGGMQRLLFGVMVLLLVVMVVLLVVFVLLLLLGLGLSLLLMTLFVFWCSWYC